MKKALLGLTGALLATSAFTTAQAAVIATNAGAQGVATAYATGAAAIDAYSAQSVTAAAQTVGAAANLGDVFIALQNSIGGGATDVTFAVRINVTGISFNSPTSYTLTPNDGADNSNSCSPFAQSATSITFTCRYDTAGANDVAITSLRLQTGAEPFVSTAAGAVGNINIDATISPDTNFLSTLESAPSNTIARFVNSVSQTVTAGTTVTIQQAAFGASAVEFAGFATNSPTATLATVTVAASATPGVLRDGTTAVDATVIDGFVPAAGGGTLTITSPIIGESAISAIELTGGVTITATKATPPAGSVFSGNTLTITLTQAQAQAIIGGGAVTITARSNQTAALPAVAAGTVVLDLTTASTGAGAAQTFQDLPAANGGTAAFSRGGFVADLNNFYTLTSAYESFIRIVNPTASAGTASLLIWNADTGALVCNATTPVVPANATLEANRATIVALCGAQLPATLPTYLNARVNGAFNGYAQHVVWNNRTTVTDLSGRRN